MAKLYADAKGVLLRLLQTEALEQRFPDPPEGAAFTLDFDEETNAAVVQALHADWNSYSMPGGVLTRGVQAVTIAAAGEAFQDRRALGANAQTLRDYMALATPTNAQTVAAVRALIRVVRYLVKKVS